MDIGWLLTVSSSDGKSNYMEGLILLALYGVIGIASWVS
jgi:Ca2+/H+ antiporter